MKENLFNLAEMCMKKASGLGAEQSEVVVNYREEYLTRFANSQIHQNVGERSLSLAVRLVKDKRIARTEFIFKDTDNLKEMVERTFSSLKFLKKDPNFKSLPYPAEIKYLPIYVKETAEATPEKRAELANLIIDTAHDLSNKVKSVSGAISTKSCEVLVSNSLGINAFSKYTFAAVNVNIMAEDNKSQGFGHSRRVTRDICEIDGKEIGLEAAEGAIKTLSPKKVDPGEYQVVLKPYAVSDLITYLAYIGLHAKSVEEGKSFMLDFRDKKAVNEKVTLFDDGTNLRGLAFPFDIEGVPKKRVEFIKKGIAKEVVYDSYTAFKENKESTGHASYEKFWTGPMPSHVFMKEGDSTLSEMVAETSKGLLITRFHYIRPVDPRKTIITGMTRDGVWLIEKGEIAYPVRNLRFTDGILRILSNVELVGDEILTLEGLLELVPSSIAAPAMKTSVIFTSLTEY